MKVAGARILVVGGVRRLGRALALDLAAHGAAVCVSSRTAGEAADAQVDALRAAGAPAAAAVAGDVRRPTAAEGLVADAAAALGGLDGLVYAASGPFVPTRPRAPGRGLVGRLAGHHRQGVLLHGARRPQALRRRPAAASSSPSPTTWACSRGRSSRRTAPPRRPRSTSSRSWRAPGPPTACASAASRRGRWTWTTTSTGRPRCERPPRWRRSASWRRPTSDAAVRFCLETDGVTGVNVVVDNGSLVMS